VGRRGADDCNLFPPAYGLAAACMHACAGPESPYGGEEHRTGPDKRRRPAGEILSLGWPGGQGKRRLTVVVWSPTPTTGTHLAACS
jgi:hypothetical protein